MPGQGLVAFVILRGSATDSGDQWVFRSSGTTRIPFGLPIGSNSLATCAYSATINMWGVGSRMWILGFMQWSQHRLE